MVYGWGAGWDSFIGYKDVGVTDETCPECEHPLDLHYPYPVDVFAPSGEYLFTAMGCMCIEKDGRIVEGTDKRRCECTKLP